MARFVTAENARYTRVLARSKMMKREPLDIASGENKNMRQHYQGWSVGADARIWSMGCGVWDSEGDEDKMINVE